MSGWGFDLGDLKKDYKGVIRKKLMNGYQLDDPLVYFEFKYNIETKEAARLLIDRLTKLIDECDQYGL